MAGRVSVVRDQNVIEESINEFNKARPKSSGESSASKDEDKKSKKNEKKKKPKQAKSVYAKSYMSSMTNKTRIVEMEKINDPCIPVRVYPQFC